MFEGDFAGTCAAKFPLMSMGGRAEGLALADPGARTPISVSGNFLLVIQLVSLVDTVSLNCYFHCSGMDGWFGSASQLGYL